jgi:hypothetical protein
MASWYICKIKIERIQEDGTQKKITEPYLVNAVSYTEVEARMAEFLEQEHAEYTIAGISKANISDIFPNEQGDKWYKAKVSFVSLDEAAGKEKKINQFMLIQSIDFEHATKELLDQFKNFTVPYDIHSLVETPIFDVIEY